MTYAWLSIASLALFTSREGTGCVHSKGTERNVPCVRCRHFYQHALMRGALQAVRTARDVVDESNIRGGDLCARLALHLLARVPDFGIVPPSAGRVRRLADAMLAQTVFQTNRASALVPMASDRGRGAGRT